MASSSSFYGGNPTPTEYRDIDELIAQAEAAAETAQTAGLNAEADANAADAARIAAEAARDASNTSATASANSATASATSAALADADAIAAANSATSAATSASNAATSANSASTSAANASASASTAQSSQTAAANSAAAASASQTSAATSASNAATSASNASSSASSAATSATAAATSAANADTSEANAQAYELSAQEWATKTSGPVAGGEYSAKYNAQLAASSATAASSSASSAATSATAADAAKTAAQSAQAAAETARDQTLTAYDNFDDRYLGAKTSDPTVDNDGNPLIAGALYFNSVGGYMKVYTGTSWVDAYAAGTAFVQKIGDTMTGALTFSGAGVASADYIDFDTATAAAGAVGRMKWNDAEGTVDLGLKGGNVTLQIGQEMVQLVVNKTGSTLLNGKAVQITGAQGNRPTVEYAQADSDLNSLTVIGILTENLANNAEGYVTTEGLVRGLDTSAFTEGAVLWLSPTTAGAITTTKPVAPEHLVMVGYCVRSHASTGEILVKVQNGYELDDLHNVKITAVANGQLLRYNSTTPAWENWTPNYVIQTSAVGSALLPSGTTGERPGTPSAGYIRYNTTTGKFEGYGSAWGNIGGGAAIGDAPPANPGAGDLWWNSADGRMYVYYTDANSSQWVDLSAGGAGQYLPLTGGTVTGNVSVTGNFGYTGTLTGGTGVINIGSGQFYKDASGNVGIGVTSPVSKLEVAGGIRARQGLPGASGADNNGYSFGGDGDTGIYSTGDGLLQFITNNTERMRINPYGAVRINTTTYNNPNDSKLWSVGPAANWATAAITVEHEGGNQPMIGWHAPNQGRAATMKYYGNGNRFEFRDGGHSSFIEIYASACVSTSDYRLKEDVEQYDGGLSAVMQLKPITFKWNTSQKNAVGFLAHEVQSVIPTAISGKKDDEDDNGKPMYQGVDPLQIVAVLASAIQELNAKVDALQSELATLKGGE